MAILYKCNFRLLTEQKVLWSNNGWSFIIYSIKRFSHSKIDYLLKALLKNGLKISPKKCHLLETNLQYIGNEIFIKDKRVCVKLLRNRLEAIQNLQPPTTVKGCRSFTGIVNFLSMFCPELQKLLKLIDDLTRKGRQFLWGKESKIPLKK